MKYLQRRANRFEFRFPLPDDVAGAPYPIPWPTSLEWCVNTKTGRFKTELIRSLRTNDTRAAERAVLPLIEEAHRLVDAARQAIASGPPSDIAEGLIAELAKEHEARLLEQDTAIRTQGVGLDLKRGVKRGVGHGMSDDDLALYKGAIDALDKAGRREAARMRAEEALQAAINRAVDERGIVLHPDDPAWRKLELAFIGAQRSAIAGIQSRLAGDMVPTPQLPRRSGDNLTKALTRWTNGNGASGSKPRQNSAFEASRAVQRFVELHGDMELAAITKAHARQFRDALAKVPKRLPQKLAKLRLPELLKRDLSNYEPRNAQTINKSLNLLSGILAKAEKDGQFEGIVGWSNPFRVTFDIAPADREAFEPFSVDELNCLFRSPVFSRGDRPTGGKGEAAYWFPLISLFCGARRTEIAQLKVGDVRKAGNTDYLDFNDEGEDQNLKNQSSARSVPIHSALIEAGLLTYVAARAAKVSPESPLWLGFEPPVAEKAKGWTKWFGRYLAAQVIDEHSKTFHSFRHTFKRACREAGISEEVHNAFTGHSGGGVGRSYGRLRRSDGTMDRGISIERLKIEIEKVSYAGLILPNSPVSLKNTPA